MKRGDFSASLFRFIRNLFYSKQGDGWVLLARFPQKAELLLRRPVKTSSDESIYI
jgi:hypothetical protein